MSFVFVFKDFRNFIQDGVARYFLFVGTFLFRLQRFRMIVSFLGKNEEEEKEKEKMEGTGRIK